jgi:AraC-like DNA-binding protein
MFFALPTDGWHRHTRTRSASVSGVRASRSLTQRRLLRDEETNFRKLLDEVRFTLAKEMLQQDLTVEQVAERVAAQRDIVAY